MSRLPRARRLASAGCALAAVIAGVGAAACSGSEGQGRFARPLVTVSSAGTAEVTVGPAQRIVIVTEHASFGRAPELHLWDSESKTEVARGRPGWFGWSTSLEYENRQPAVRKFTLLYESARPGREKIDLLRDGRSWLQSVAIAERLALPHGKGYVAQVASTPGGARDVKMFGLDCEGRLRAVDERSGPTGLPRIEGVDDLCSVVLVARAEAARAEGEGERHPAAVARAGLTRASQLRAAEPERELAAGDKERVITGAASARNFAGAESAGALAAGNTERVIAGAASAREFAGGKSAGELAAGNRERVIAGAESAPATAGAQAERELAAAESARPVAIGAAQTATGAEPLPPAAPTTSPLTAAARRVGLYVNDPDDHDGDGLGRSLERALGTCDGPLERGCRSGVLAEYYRGHGATRDSDRDGISDGDEVLGAGPFLDLPRYGASPRHKDVFVEVDYDPRTNELGMSETDFADVAALYAVGSARELRNPDGQPGVHLHFDAGFDPVDPAHLGLVGDWGGSGRASSNNYRAARASDFTAARAGYFRYAFLTRTGRGQARRDAITVNRDLNRVAIFAHELGHTLGLEHNGQAAWGTSNCKPNYYSLMNYVYQNRPGVGFSRRAGTALDPAAAWETISPDDGLPPDALREPPLELDVLDGGIDWNRDGLISRVPVRAGLSWATYKSCGSAGFARTTLTEQALLETTPVLTHLRDQLYALFLTADGGLHVRHSLLSGPDAGGSCPEGDGIGTKCTTWSLESSVHGLQPVQRMAAVVSAGELLVGYTTPTAQLRLARLAPEGEVLEVRSDVEIAGARSDFAPAVAIADVESDRYGQPSVLRVLYREAGLPKGEARRANGPHAGALMQATSFGPDGPFRLTPVHDTHAQAIAVGLAPSVARLGTGELCGAFPDVDRYVRFYCYEPAMDGWRDLTSTAFFEALGPQTAGAVGIAYHRYRNADGSLVTGDASRGAVILSFTEPESPYAKNPDNPHYYISEWLSAEHPAATALYFRWRGSVIDEWTNLAPGTSLAIYEDETLSSLKALMLAKLPDPDRIHLDFLPFADGVHEDFLGSGNDFEVMERGICKGIKDEASCEPAP